MTVELIYQTTWETLRTVAGDKPLRSFAPGTVSSNGLVSQRVAFPPNPMPSVQGAVGLTHEFANDQELVGLGGFTGTSGTGITSLGEYGAIFNGGGGVSGGGFAVGSGHYWEEGVILIVDPVGTVGNWLGNDPATITAGRLSVRLDGGIPRFQFQQSNASGNDNITLIFDDIDVPVTSLGPGSPLRPIYYRLCRNIPVAGNGSVQLRVWSNGTAQSQAFGSLPRPNPPASQPLQLGGTGNGSIFPDYTMVLWWRSQSSNTYPGSLTFGFSDYWLAPKVFETAQYASHGISPGSFIDSGFDDVYWHTLTFPTILQRAGGAVGVRTAATNTPPGGTGQALMSGPYETVSTLSTVDLGNAQGRYLAVELQFVPGTENDLDMGEAVLQGAFAGAAEMGAATWGFVQAVVPGSGLIEIPIGGEGAAVASLPIAPEYPVQVSEVLPVSRFRSEFPYTTTRPFHSSARRKWRLRWAVDTADRDTLLDFFDALRGGESAFSWIPPGDVIATDVFLRGSVNTRHVGGDAHEITADVEEVR